MSATNSDRTNCTINACREPAKHPTNIHTYKVEFLSAMLLLFPAFAYVVVHSVMCSGLDSKNLFQSFFILSVLSPERVDKKGNSTWE